ncbi:PREDICTED: uncharacterized protein LOC109221391 [Nicotiana attenuata]|uniref:uncharacterized protein LOC109221391 n=1 Tax=Nicotiana attenuata TaxID=49451 RepID=UPI00090544FF|nr:PREDICTED: uncharacterized protein LOC109221391 [Nicotiana attenuata]
MRNTRTSPRSSGKLNAAATVFDPNTTRKEATKEGLSSNPSRNTNKEFTAQWVNRAFLDPNVTTNQSCQEIPSQSLYTSVIPEQENLKDRVNFIGGRLWCQQHEEESYEGEFLEGHEDVEEVHVEDPDVEEQSVNGKRDRSEVQGVVDGINAKGATDQPLQLDQYHINPNSLSIPNQESSSVEKQDPIAQPKDPGDPEDPGDNSAAIQHQQLEGIQKGGDLKLQQNVGPDAPWLVGGDFNVIWDEEEKFGGLPVHINEIDHFRHCINTCNLFDLGFKGSIYTWWNGRAEKDCIFKRLDRCVRNMELQQFWPGLEISHLSKIGSDHSPMHLSCNPSSGPIKKAFRFLNFWIKHDTLLDVAKESWQKALSIWSKATFGDIFQKLASLEEVVKVHETQFELNPTIQNRERLQKVQSDLIRVWAIEEDFWKQKADQKDTRQNWKLLEDSETIANEAVHFFEQQFHEESIPTDFSIINYVPSMMTEEQNYDLTRLPTIEEVKRAIIGDDIVEMVKAFFCGHELPKFVTRTNLVLLPKKKEVQTFSYLRPISLSNFTNKIISRVIHERLVDILPSVISDEQAGFVKGRSIVENVLLTQEIITDTRLRTKAGPNVFNKLDMMKAYNRLSWLFLTKVLRKMGFSERGVKQGDPLSPTLFILAAEALSKGLNALHQNLYFCGFGLPKWSPKINHLAYADDTIIYSSSDATSLRLIMEILNSYEAASGQLINKTKSAVYVHHSTNEEVVRKIERVTRIERQDFPFIYLGCPIFYSRRRMDYYEVLITKVLDKIQSWKGRLLSIGGRAVLINSVLQSMPIHLLSAVNPPNYVINKLHNLFARFYWSNSTDGRARQWASWDTLCLPYYEGGVGFRSLHDMSKALFCKLWWNFRTKPSLWSCFMSQKYCKKLNTIVVPWRGGSLIWRKMLECRDLVEPQIFWKLKMGSSLF